ncbi:MAG: YggS family pyridoxal phosphate-dependent enzyme [Minicystis sp.]
MGSDIAGIVGRLAEVHRQIDEACRKAGRTPDAVRLLAVSKTQPAEAVRAAYAAGQREFGENYAQELDEKAAALADLPDLRWHAIGQLQRNKVKQVVKSAAVVQAVDRAELGLEIDKRAAAIGRTIAVMVEVNVGGEASKGGCAPGDLGALLASLRSCAHLRVTGLMTIPPATDDPEEARPFFAVLRALRDRHGGVAALPELSMGMSHDFAAAIAEGATLVRVGTAIFGARG